MTESFCFLIKIIITAFYRSLEVVRIFWEKNGKIIDFGFMSGPSLSLTPDPPASIKEGSKIIG